MTLSIKDLLKCVQEEIGKVIPTAKDIRLEQFEQHENGDWHVVVSYLLEDYAEKRVSSMEEFIKPSVFKKPAYERVFKRIVLNNEGALTKFDMYPR